MTTSRSIWPLAILAAGVLLGAGCNIVGPAFYFIHGPEKAKKLYTLDAKKTAVIFVDDRGNHIPRRASRVLIAQTAETMLLEEKAVKDMVSTQSAMLAAGKDVNGRPMPIAEIGRAVQADVVIYATVDDFHLTTNGQTFEPGATLRVKVFDAVNDKRLWPADKPEGHAVVVRLSPKTDELPSSTAARFQAEDELARQCGTELGWLFVTHEKPTGLKSPD
jgi:hypothetical protein